MFKTTIKAIIIIGSLIGMTFSNTSLAKANPVTQEDIAIERVNSSSVKIIHAYLKTTDSALILKGKLQRRLHTSRLMPGYLQVELLGPDGSVFKEANIGYKRNNTKSHLARFRLPIPVETGKISRVRITHHDALSDGRDLEKSPWRDAKTD